MITLDHVTFGYRKGTLFSGLDLTLKGGAVYGLLGKNGAGKTTLLKLITGLLFPRSGAIQVLGYDPRLRQPLLLNQIFFLPEEFDLPRLTMNQYAEKFGPFYPNFSEEQLEKVMVEFEVTMNHPFHQMSFGQKKKAYIAFAIACNTPLLVMDEPTNGLDIPSKVVFRRVIASVADENRTMIISTHQVRDLDQLIDAVVILDESEILLNTSTREITDRLRFVHLSEGESAIYSEQTIHGLWGVKENTAGEESPLDMELLFNAVVTSRGTIKQLFNTQK